MRRVLIISGATGAILALLVAVVAGLFWYFTNQPLYKPGMVGSGQNLRVLLAPPEQSEDDHVWTVEEDIQVHHFSAGQGRTVLVVQGGPGYPYLEP
jgi:hypothetical protein